MKTGIAVPVGVDKQGRTRLVSGEDQTRKLVMLALSPGENANPFQNLGLVPPIFDLADPATQARVRARVEDAFRVLTAAGRARLAPGGLAFEEGDAGTLVLRVTYVNLESGSETDLVLPDGRLP